MTQPVIIPFQVEGVDRVLGAFRTIKDALRDLAYISPSNTATDAFAGGAKAAVAATKEATKEAIASDRARTVAAEREADRRLKLELANLRTAESARKQGATVDAAAERQKTSVAEAEAKRRHQLEVANIRANATLQAQDVANKAAVERQKTTIEQRELDRRMMLERQSMSDHATLQRQQLAHDATLSQQRQSMAQNEAARRHQADRASHQQWASTITGSVRGTVGTMVGLAGAAMALGGGFTLADAVQGELSAQGAARALSIQSGAYSQDPKERKESVSDEQVLTRAKAVSIQTGYKLEEIIGAMQKSYDKSGNVQSTLEITPFMAQISRAFNVNLADTASVAGAALNSGRTVNETQAALRIAFSQGRAGSIDPGDLAHYATRLVGASEHFKDRNAAMADLGAGLQLSPRGSIVDAAEATTAMGRVADRLSSKSRVFSEQFGVDVFADHKTGALRGMNDIILELIPAIAKTAAHDEFGFKKGKKGSTDVVGFLSNQFGLEGAKFMQGYYQTFNRGRVEEFERQDREMSAGKRKKGDYDIEAGIDAGMKELRAGLEKFSEGPKRYNNEVQESAARLAAPDLQIAVEYEKLRQAIGEQIVPELLKLVPALKGVIPHIQTAIEMTAKGLDAFNAHPVLGIGAIIVAKVGADIASAAIGAAISRALVGAIAAPAAVAAVTAIAAPAAGAAVTAIAAPAAGAAVTTAAGGVAAAGAGAAASAGGGTLLAVGAPAAAIAIGAGLAIYAGKSAIDSHFDQLAKTDSSDAAYPALLTAQSARIERMPDGPEKLVARSDLLQDARKKQSEARRQASEGGGLGTVLTVAAAAALAPGIRIVQALGGNSIGEGMGPSDVNDAFGSKQKVARDRVSRIQSVIDAVPGHEQEDSPEYQQSLLTERRLWATRSSAPAEPVPPEQAAMRAFGFMRQITGRISNRDAAPAGQDAEAASSPYLVLSAGNGLGGMGAPSTSSGMTTSSADIYAPPLPGPQSSAPTGEKSAGTVATEAANASLEASNKLATQLSTSTGQIEASHATTVAALDRNTAALEKVKFPSTGGGKMPNRTSSPEAAVSDENQ